MNLGINASAVFEALQQRHERILVLEGSSGSTKTYSIIQYLIDKALKNETKKKGRKNLRFLCLRSRLTWAKDSIMYDFRTILRDQFGMWDERDLNKSSNMYKLGHSEFTFGGLDHDNGQKFHGPRWDYAWFNEAIEIDYPSVKQILIRLETQAIFDYNPRMNKKHWLITKIKPRRDCAIIHSTYKDNLFLPNEVINEIENYEPTEDNIKNGTADETMWKIYGLGMRAEVQGLIFEIKIVPTFPDVDKFCYGMDFGFNDPVTLIKSAEKNGELYFHEELYERGLTNISNPHNPSQHSIEERFIELKIPAKKRIWADCAEPKSIADLQNCGYDVQPVKKGAGSIFDGIMTLKRYPINVTESSMNMIDEAYKYKWKQDKNGDSLNEPVDSDNHCWDPARYSVFMDQDISPHRGKPKIESLKMNFNLSQYGY